ncbi:MAG: hypothetical protein JXJ04_08025 [Spirochaetales bacterium]|nr:hypothetical protein [Spirochaetales bacterium]
MTKEDSGSKQTYSTAERLMSELQLLSQQISNYSNRGLTRVEFLSKSLLKLIKTVTCDEIELWIFDREKQNNDEIIKQTKDSFFFRISTLLPDIDEKMNLHPGEDPAYHLFHKTVIAWYCDPGSPFFTEKGSVWINNRENNLSSPKESGISLNDNIFRVDKFIKSLIIIPLMNDNKGIGLLHLKSKNINFFTKSEIVLFENFAQTFGIALLNQRAQAALRERVKELTCMYGIAQSARAGVSLDEIMQDTVKLLPQAWQYPEIAHCKIELNNKVYTTPGYRDSPYKQRADIIVKKETSGFVELVYLEKKMEIYEGPFLREERNLIDNIAKALSITIEQKQAEEDKKRLEKQIRHADRLATIGQLSAGIAHELNEPIGNILGFAQLLSKNKELPHQIHHDIGRIINASLHAREIVKKLLIFARQMPAHKVKVCLNHIVNEGLYLLESRCMKEGITLRLLLEENLPEIIADPGQMTQVLVNLAVNAIQAMPDGGILKVQTSTQDTDVLLMVEDTGEGIHPDDLKQIFLPFFTTKEIGQGTGLGLAVVHGIVTSHGGCISVLSKVNQGSKFEIKFPII